MAAAARLRGRAAENEMSSRPRHDESFPSESRGHCSDWDGGIQACGTPRHDAGQRNVRRLGPSHRGVKGNLRAHRWLVRPTQTDSGPMKRTIRAARCAEARFVERSSKLGKTRAELGILVRVSGREQLPLLITRFHFELGDLRLLWVDHRQALGRIDRLEPPARDHEPE